ncbi:hypothetical protein DRQ05_04730, partial [bacterium]
MTDKKISWVLAFAIFIICLITYLLTMAATVSFWDSGEFIATSYILGIPHSPGTPLYVLVGRLFTMLPLPMTIAQKVNFLSVLFSALAVMFGFLVMVNTLKFMFGELKSRLERFVLYIGPLVGSFYLIFSDTYWRDSTEAEVYSLSAFVMAFSTWLALLWYRNPAGKADDSVVEELKLQSSNKKELDRKIAEIENKQKVRSHNLLYLIIYLLALGIGFHLGTIIVYGGIFLLVLLVKEKSITNTELFIFTFGMVIIVADMTIHTSPQVTLFGLIIFAILVAWSTASKGRFVLAATALFVLAISVHLYLYIRSHLNPAIDEVDPQTWRALYAHLRREQYPPMSIFNRKAPFLFQLKYFWDYFIVQYRMIGDKMVGPFNLGIATVGIPMALGVLGMIANYYREKKVWVLNFTNFLLNSLGLIIFLNFSDHEVRERDYFYAEAFFFFALFIGIGTSGLLAMTLDYFREKKKAAGGYVVSLGVILLVLSILPAHHYWHSHDRSNNYIPRDYAYNMLAGLEPDAIIFTNGDNDTFPLWYIQCVEHFRTDVRVANLSLLNTSWYIRQLRDEEPKVPITLNDEEIEQLRPIRLKDGTIAWKRDLAVQHIIQTTNWKRPIYFAVTVPLEVWKPYEDYLEMQGMERRLVPYKGKDMINEFMLARNFNDVYEFRGVLNPDGTPDTILYKDKDTKGMFINFAVAAAQLGQRKAMKRDFDDAIHWLKLSLALSPDFSWPRMLLGTYYYMNGDIDGAVNYYKQELKKDPKEGEFWVRVARIFESQKEYSEALQFIDRGISTIPNYRQLYSDGFRIAAKLGKPDTAKSYISNWLTKHPDDEQLSKIYDKLDEVLKEEFGINP